MTTPSDPIHEGCIVVGSLFNEPIENVDEGRFRAICQNALEGLAAKKPIRFPLQEVTKVAHYWLEVNAMSACDAQASMTRPVTVREDQALYGREKS